MSSTDPKSCKNQQPKITFRVSDLSQAASELEGAAQYCDEWLVVDEDYRLATAKVRRIRDDYRLAANTLRNWQPEWGEPPIETIKGLTVSVNDLRRDIPLRPRLNIDLIGFTSTGSGTICNTMAGQIPGSFDDTDSAAVRLASATFHKEHSAILHTYVKPDEVRSNLVAKLNKPEVVGAFDNAVKAHEEWRAGIKSRVDAAGAIRSLLEEFWGRLWERVRKPSEQEIKPDLMVARLAAGQPGGREELVIQTNWHIYRDVQDGSGKRDGLHRKASNVFHRREGKFTVDLAEVWGETLDHINAVLLASNL